MKLHPNIKYRSDIDGLRALAVLSVILFHINAKWIPGGFLGVDIFFVISGYLITLILTKEVATTDKINIVNFYKRRIKRIIPALLFVLIPVFITSFLIMAPDDLLSLAKSMIWSFFSVANIYFYLSIDTGYFATGSSELPLLHLWSLGVEEQFYILWPFIVLYLLRYIPTVKKQLLLVSVLFIVSLVWAQLIIVENHSFAYYMLPTRSWELLAGAFAALLVHSGFRTKNLTNDLMAIIGLLAIIFSFIFVSEADPVPGVAALPVILGTTLLILSGISYQTYIGRLLSFKVFVAIGLVSYSAYLWHWPILAFLRYALVDIDLTVAFIVILVTFTMATISYFFIETPLRKNNVSTKNVFIWYFIIPAIGITAVSTLTIQGIKHKSSWIFPWEKLNTLKSDTLAAYAYKFNCQDSLFDIKIYSENRCIYPKNIEKANVFLIGDSNAAHYLGMLRIFSKHYGFSIRNATSSGCPMVFDNDYDWVGKTYQKGCSKYSHSVEKEAKKYDTVIVGGSWDYYYNKKGFNTSFKNTIEQLSKNVKHVILLAKVPLFPAYNKNCDIRAIRLNTLDCSNHFNNTLKDDVSNEFLRSIAKKYNNVDYFEVRKVLCKNKICSPYLDAIPVCYSAGHLSMKGSELIGKQMLESDDPMLHVFDHLHNLKQIYRTPDLLVKDEKNSIIFTVSSKFKNVKVAFYLYKNGKRIDTQWYSKSLSYKLNKKQYGKGKYKVKYFIVDKNIENPGKTTKFESSYSKEIWIK